MSEIEKRLRESDDTKGAEILCRKTQLRALLADLDAARARVKESRQRAERAEAERYALRLMVREDAAWAQENEAIAARLARCEAMLVEGKGQIAACGNQGLVRRIDAYFAEQEPRTC